MKKNDVMICRIESTDDAAEIVNIHMDTFTDFFLTFLGKGFLAQLYKGFITHPLSGVIGAFSGGKLTGFVAYSQDLSGFYKYLIKRRLIPFAWYALLGFLRKPRSLGRLLRALTYPKNSQSREVCITLSSIGVKPAAKGLGIGSKLVEALKQQTDFQRFSYIKLETDRENNEYANRFYLKNGFVLANSYCASEGRWMNEYHYSPRES